MLECKWAVAYKIKEELFDDRKERTCITALFRYPDLAQDFIDKVLPEETRHMFFVTHIDNI